VIKKFITAVSFIIATLIYSINAARATESIMMDGNWWSALSESQKLAVTEALDDAIPIAFENGYWNAQGYFKQSLSKADFDSDVPSSLLPSYSKTFGVYKSEIDDFYDRHPDAMSVTISQVFLCLNDNGVGLSCDQVAKNAATKAQ